MLLPSRIYIARGPWHLRDFRNIFLPNVGEDQKKSRHLSKGPLAGTAPYYGKSGPSYCITFIKRLDEGSDGGTILKVRGPKVYPVFSPTAHNAQLYAYSDFRCFGTSYCNYSMPLKVTGTTKFVLKSAPMNVIPSRN